MDDHGIRVLDGGLSNALAERGLDLSGGLWTARLLLDAPGEIAAVHRAYFAAGASVATTASYQASLDGFVDAGMTRGEAETAIRASVGLAREVRDGLAGDGVDRLVAASVGPYGAVLADGSEYRGRYGLSRAALRDFHAPRIDLLVSAGPDLLAAETVPDLEEAEVLVELLAETGLPWWLSFTVAGDRTRAGQPLADAFAVAAGRPGALAVGVNCCAPEDVLPAVRTAVAASGLPAIAYPNRGETWDALARAWVGAGAFDPAPVAEWVAAGVTWVGGCCRVGPEDITAIAAAVAGQPEPE
ncbi:homocysteine S-methyltransferase [Agromyces seonyuensis]|uniref:Homocysteine S-methyltransferase n=1 Tax=Agromyces seonyuensis TaxID=2662446 RepID=A0A6I4P7K7_9MICO|nr:homocysteine S-methyltransferase [Agromyces seonyuensis]MWB99777.1 homocysteine S-methyltransferase [Agromyces seonyuensis]